MSLSLPAKEHAATFLQRLHSWFTEKLDEQRPKGAIASLDGIRAMAFLIVLCYHMRLMTSHLHLWNPPHWRFIDALTGVGFTGVTLFFVLSGFLLFLPYTNALLLNKPWPEAKIFYLRRILRIFPAYFVALFMLVMLQSPYLLNPHNWTKLLPFLTFTMDFSNSQLVDGPIWTLAVECQYYLILPLIALAIYGLTRLVRSEKRLWVVLCCLFAIIAWGMALRYIANQSSMTFPGSRTTLNRILAIVYGEKGKFPEDFAVGMLAAVLYVFFKNAPEKDKYLRIMQRLSPWLGIVSVSLFVYAAMRSYSIADRYAWPVAPGVFRIFPWSFDVEIDFALSYGCCIMGALFDRPGGFFRRLFEWNPLRWVGTLTFSLYIWHIPFIAILQNNLGPGLLRMNHYAAILLCWILVLGIALPFCFIMYVTIEKPNIHLSERLRQRLLLKKRVKTENTTLPRNPLQQEKDSEQTLQSQNHSRSDTNSQVGVAMEWVPANTDSEQCVRGPQLSPAQATNRFLRNKHRLQPLPMRETDTPKP